MKQLMIMLLTVPVVALMLSTSTAEAKRSPYAKPDRSWITLTGDVVESSPQQFRLDYGEGLITVEMDDWDWYDEADHIMAGDRVTVYGRIDDDLYQRRTIEADSVYVYDRNTYYYANDADEEDFVYYSSVVTIPDGAWTSVNGTVEKIDGRELVLDTGVSKIRVDTINMAYNPLDEVGYQKIKKGDRVSVWGRLDLDFFEKREIQADSIVTLSRDKTKKSK
ncbi:MAG TPA: NirD/YgiW/YdeI family stress tolerance protein [Polyangiales bacterium]|nr:NirD/YgiW/YdeI family stress tolerance protein [Polyangiales bacterium]